MSAPNNKRRRSSDGISTPSSPKFAAIQSSFQNPPMLISLPSSSTTMKRRAPLTPPSVTPASITVSDHTPLYSDRRDRCQSPQATDLLAKVVDAVVSSQPPVPTGIRGWASRSSTSGSNSLDSTPNATPPEDCGEFFESRKSLPETPGGTYISFPELDGYDSDDNEPSKQ